MQSITISVIIPILNVTSSDFEKCLTNIETQNRLPDEVIFSVEDNDTGKFIQTRLNTQKNININYKVLLNIGNRGIGHALKNAVDAATGEVIVRHDVDDFMVKDRIAFIHKLYKADPAIQVTYSNAFLYSDNIESERSFPMNQRQLMRAFVYCNPIIHPTVAFRKSTVHDFGSYQADLRFCEDLDLWLRWIRRGVQFTYIDQKLVNYNLPPRLRSKNNWTANFTVRRKNLFSPNLLYGMCGLALMLLFNLLPKNFKNILYLRLR